MSVPEGLQLLQQQEDKDKLQAVGAVGYGWGLLRWAAKRGRLALDGRALGVCAEWTGVLTWPVSRATGMGLRGFSDTGSSAPFA